MPTAVNAVAVSLRSGSPTSLLAKPWAASSRAGAVFGGERLDRSTRLVAADEQVMTVLEGEVLTRNVRDGRLHLRGLEGSGDRPVAPAGSGSSGEATRWVSAAPFGRQVLLTGMAWDGRGRDTGILALDVATGSLHRLADPVTSLPAGLGPDVFRTLVLEPPGAAGATALCDGNRCVVSAIDPSTGSATGSVAVPEALVAARDGAAIVVSQTTLRAVDLPSGRTRWQLGDAEFQDGFRLDDGRWVQSYIDHRGGWRYTIAVIDLATGRRRAIWTAPVDGNRVLYPELSTAGAVSFGSQPLSVGLDSPLVSASVLDLASGQLFENALRLSTR